MQVFRVLAAQLDVLDDPDQHFVSALFESRGVTQVVLHLEARRRPLEPLRRVFVFPREAAWTAPMIGTSARTIQRMMPPASLRIPRCRHEVRKITELAEKLAGPSSVVRNSIDLRRKP
jgi:hypothetical protein